MPVDAIAKEDLPTLVPVLHAAPLADFARLGRAAPVLRLSGGLAHVDAPFTLVGLPPNDLTQVRWRSDNASLAPDALARQIAFPAPLHGIRLPVAEYHTPGARARAIRSRWTRTSARRAGDFVRVRLGTATGKTTLRARFDASQGLVAADVRRHEQRPARSRERGHRRADDRHGSHVRPLRARTARSHGWIGTNGVQAHGGNTIRYLVSPQLTSRFRAHQVTDDRPVPVLATPRIAAAAGSDGRLALEVEGQPLIVQVAGTISRFPTVNGDALVADGEAAYDRVERGVNPGARWRTKSGCRPRTSPR